MKNTLEVTPEELDAKAHLVSAQIAEMKKNFEAMERAINRTKQYWIGEAGDAHREAYYKKKDDISTMLRRWDEEVEDMFIMKETYAKAEREAKELIVELPSDVII